MHKNVFLLRQCKDEASKRILKNESVSQNFRMSALRLPKVCECLIIKVWVLYAWGRQITGASQVVLVARNLSDNAGDVKRPRFDPWVGKILWGRAWQPSTVFLPGSPMKRGAWWATAHRLTQSWTCQITMSVSWAQVCCNYFLVFNFICALGPCCGSRWDLNSPTRDGARGPRSGSSESQPPGPSGRYPFSSFQTETTFWWPGGTTGLITLEGAAIISNVLTLITFKLLSLLKTS